MTSTTTTTRPHTHPASSRTRLAALGLCVVDAALIVISGIIHYHLGRGAYRHVATLNWLFIVQFAVCLVAAATLLATRHLIVVAGCWLLMAGTIVGFILARARSIFGFHLAFSTTLANQALGVEIAAVVLLTVTGWLLWRRA